MAAIHPTTFPVTAPAPVAAPPAAHVVFPDDRDEPVASGTLLERDLRRDLTLGVLIGFVSVFVAVAIPLTATMGWAYGLGVAAMAAFWCGSGFGLIAGAAAYAAKSHH